MLLISYLYNIWISLIITAPFWNEAFFHFFRFPLYFIIIFLSLILYFLSPIYLFFISKRRKLSFQKILMIFFITLGISTYIVLGILIAQGIIYEKYLVSRIVLTLFLFLPLLIIFNDCYDEEKFKGSIIFFSALGIFLSICNIEYIFYALKNVSRTVFFSNPISISVLAGFILISTINIRKNIYKVPFFIFSIFSLFLGLSRGPIVALFLSLFLTNLKKRKQLKILILLLLIFVFIVVIRHLTTGEANIFSREKYISTALNILNENIFFGYGLASSWKYLGIYPHNFIIQIFFEGGLVSFMLFYFVLVLIFLKISKHTSLISQVSLYCTFILLFSFDYSKMWSLLILLYSLLILECKRYVNISKYRIH